MENIWFEKENDLQIGSCVYQLFCEITGGYHPTGITMWKISAVPVVSGLI